MSSSRGQLDTTVGQVWGYNDEGKVISITVRRKGGGFLLDPPWGGPQSVHPSNAHDPLAEARIDFSLRDAFMLYTALGTMPGDKRQIDELREKAARYTQEKGRKDFELIDAWLLSSGMSEVDLGREVAGNPNAIADLREGAAAPDTMLKVLAYIKRQRGL